MTDYAALYADHAEMADHWWWRPGWQVGTRFYAWHITQAEHPDVVRLATTYQRALGDIETLDSIPAQWLHMTVQGLGHVGDTPPSDVDRTTRAVATRLADLDPISTSYQRAHVSHEAIILPPENPERFTELRRAIREGTVAALGHCPEPDDGFRAHVSVAYSNGTASAGPIRNALDAAEPGPAATTYTHASLIVMHRDRYMYEWETIDEVRIGPQ